VNLIVLIEERIAEEANRKRCGKNYIWGECVNCVANFLKIISSGKLIKFC
jgi:hypothetical protein